MNSHWISRLKATYLRWWRRLPPSRQDRLATIGPLISVLLFLTTITTTFWYLRNEEIGRESDSVQRDVEITQQQIALRLIENQEQLVRIAREVAQREIGRANFESQSETLVDDRWEITQLSWVDAQRKVRRLERGSMNPLDASEASAATSTQLLDPQADHPSSITFELARQTRRPQYSAPFKDVTGRPVFQLHVPLIDRGAFAGALVAEYSVEALIWRLVPADVSRRHRISALGPDATALASTNPPMPGRERETASIVHDVPLTPALNGVVLRGEGWRTSIGLISNTLFWMVMALSVLTLWMLLGNWRHLRRRAQIQQALVKETQFRRAMENSMVTGMRALDMDGRITYVNAAFCQMIGYSEPELLGRVPPYPYWPPDRAEENQRLLRQEMQGRSPAGGIEVRLMRKDGQLFDARMYVSPLVDLKGQQTGWMTSMTNITEAKRIRDQLSASHERFTTVLEGLDASVSVQSVQQGDLLFANRSYRLWFGADGQGHRLLTGSGGDEGFDSERHGDVDPLSGLPMHELTEATGELREIYVDALKKWFEVRSRYLQWTDGRLAQMVIATDVTARVKAEEVAKQQAEKAAVTSRLMTMGEMASTVAHELNQPLTAITNYCNGMVSRVTAGTISGEGLLVALRKTAHQAERAGKIIHRIRAFVKRSEPQRQAVNARTVVDNAVELAGIELRRRHVAIRTYVAQRLPVLKVDPILIEQVLLNLMKNAAEAIDLAGLPSSRRHLELRVVPRYTPEDGGGIEFSVTDAGPGLPEEVLNRLYEAFYSTKSDGMGIGLSLCRSIVESHHGRMRAQNLYNGNQVVGCRFSFTLPVDLPSSSEAQAAPATVETPPTPRVTAPEPATLP
ncbi:MAG: PAS domain-containing sensor histidine kinase [Rubrivivax sp.]